MSLSKGFERPQPGNFQVRFNKNQLNTLGTLLGLTAGIATVLGTQEVISPKIAGTISGIATVCLGYVVQQPANKPPTTEDVEEDNVAS